MLIARTDTYGTNVTSALTALMARHKPKHVSSDTANKLRKV